MKIYLIVLLTAITVSLYSQTKLPRESRGLFSTSGNCALCHSGNLQAHKINGLDVSPVNQWRSTMMANASKDPFWKAKVETELGSLKNENLRKIAGDMCLKCHSPMAYTDAVKNNILDYSFDKSQIDKVAMDGVSCALCHQINKSNLGSGSSYAGNYIIENNRIIWGPYEDPFIMPMINHENYRPDYSDHLSKSDLCAVCHTVITPFVDENENVSGVFFEQTPYIEWKNSSYPENGITCQSCHMPEVADSVDISSVPPPHKVYRKPYWFHTLAGGNNTMQKIFLNNEFDLGLTSDNEHHLATLKAVENNLTEEALSLSAKYTLSENILQIEVKLENLTGHKLPTGIPFRRMWVHLIVKDENQNVIFESGKYNNNGNITGMKAEYEPHHEVITEENQIQIYEGIMGDINNGSTLSLLRASKFIKDNRLPPVGFLTKHISYDTVAVCGDALKDNNFNKSETEEGTGSDIIYYKIKAKGKTKFLAEIEVCYQSIKPEVLEYFEKFSFPLGKSFINMYNKSGLTPTIMKKINLVIG